MRSFLTVFLSVTALAGTISGVSAAETRVVPANRATAIVFHYTLSPDCYAGGKPTFHITSGPAHGNVTSAWKGFRMGKGSGTCAGKPVHGSVVTYKPNPGYHGPDRVSFVFTESEGNDYYVDPREYTIDITVK